MSGGRRDDLEENPLARDPRTGRVLRHPDFFERSDTPVGLTHRPGGDDDDDRELLIEEAIEDIAGFFNGIVKAEQEMWDRDNAGDEVGHLFEGYFEPWLSGHAAEVVEWIEENADDDVKDAVEALAQLDEDALTSVVEDTSLYSGHTGPHSYYKRGVYSINNDEHVNEQNEVQAGWAEPYTLIGNLLALIDKDEIEDIEKQMNLTLSGVKIHLTPSMPRK